MLYNVLCYECYIDHLSIDKGWHFDILKLPSDERRVIFTCVKCRCKITTGNVYIIDTAYIMTLLSLF